MTYLQQNNRFNKSPFQLTPGNIIPNEWYQRFTDKRGSPDLAVISILAEIVYWYRPKKVKDSDSGEISYVTKFKDDAWQTSYDHFRQKFCLNRERIRRSLVKLEEMGIIAREFRTVTMRGQKYSNRLFIHLAAEFLKSLVFNNNKKEEEQREQGGSDNSSTKGFSSNVSIDFVTPRFMGGYPQIEGQYICNKNKRNKFRSNELVPIKTNSESNFVKSNLEKEEQESKTMVEEKLANTSIKTTLTSKPKQLTKTRDLKDFYPLSQQLCDRLQTESGREFNLNAMNEILLDMSRKLPERTFFSKKGFISYMGKALKNELRDAVKISNESFKINANKGKEEIESSRIEQYLRAVELNRDTSTDTQMRKKLASVFVPDKAYELLRVYESAHRKGTKYELSLRKYIKLSKRDKEIILKQARSVYERIDTEGNYHPITHLSIIMPEYNEANVKKYTADTNYKELSNSSLPSGMWGSIRRALIGKYGASIDKAWFDKLDVQISSDKKIINLKAPSEFIKDWIDRNYRIAIEAISSRYGLRVGWL